MHQRTGRFAALAGASALVVSTLAIGGGSASATPVGAVPFSQAVFHGYATGDELHLGITALDNLLGATGLGLNSLDQALSSASTSTTGLTSGLTSELGTLIQPAQASSVKAFNLGSGLQLDLGQIGTTVNSLLNSVKTLIPLPSISFAPPNAANPAQSAIGPINLDPILDASAIGGQALAAWPGTACPTGNLSYGLGNLASANVLTGLPTLTSAGVSSAPLISTAGSDGGQAIAQTKSLTTMISNPDGSYGIQTQAQNIIAPITVNLLGIATLKIGVHAANGNLDPVTLTSTTTGEGPGKTVMSTDDLLTVTLTAAGSSTPVINESIPLTAANNGTVIPLSLTGVSDLLSQLTLPNLVAFLQNILNGLPSGSTLSSTLNTVLGQLTPLLSPVEQVLNTVTPTVQQLISQLNSIVTLNLGSITIGTVPHALSLPSSADPNGTSGALDLLNIKLGLTNSSINIPQQVAQGINIPATLLKLPDILLANPVVGHIESASSLNSPIACTVTQNTGPPTPQQPPAPTPGPTPAPVHPAALPFTGGPGGLWQPVTGVALLGVGGGSLALIRRLRKRSVL